MDDILDPKWVIAAISAASTAGAVWLKGVVRRNLAAARSELSLTEKLYADTALIRQELWKRMEELERSFAAERERMERREEDLTLRIQDMRDENTRLKVELAATKDRVGHLERKLREAGLPENGH